MISSYNFGNDALGDLNINKNNNTVTTINNHSYRYNLIPTKNFKTFNIYITKNLIEF